MIGKAFKNMLIWALRRGQTKTMIRRAADMRTQLEKFNAIWEDAVENVPFYADWAERHHLPRQIGDLKELASWPVLSKQDLIRNREKLTRKGVAKFHESVTGGATGEPLHFRTMAGESDEVAVNKWIGWARVGIFPDSRCFVLWGHRHFYGQGLASNVRFKIRQLKDWVTNNKRADATNLSSTALRKDYEMMRKFAPECIIAYSASLLALVRVMREDREVQSNNPSDDKAFKALRAIICTAGPLTKEERATIGAFFKVPVSMEYGSMEAGVMAYQTQKTANRYSIFDDTHILHTITEPVTGRHELLATKLYPCYLPLIRYRIGDYVSDPTFDYDGKLRDFSEVFGRVGDEVDMGNGIRFHGQSFMTCAEDFDKIIAYQIRINRVTGKVVFVAQTTAVLSDGEKEEIVKRAAHMSGLSVGSISIEERSELIKAPSGKIRLVVDAND